MTSGRGAPQLLQPPIPPPSRPVVAYLDGFLMPDDAGRPLLVRRIGLAAADVGGRGRDDAVQLVVRRLHAPKAATGEGGLGSVRGCSGGGGFRGLRGRAGGQCN